MFIKKIICCVLSMNLLISATFVDRHKNAPYIDEPLSLKELYSVLYDAVWTRDVLIMLKENTNYYWEKMSPIVIFNQFCNDLTDITFKEDLPLLGKERFKIENNIIHLSGQFSNSDIPMLIKAMENNNMIQNISEKLSEEYLNHSNEINEMLKLSIWQKKDETTRHARRIWSRRAYFYYGLSLSYKGIQAFDSYTGELKKEIMENYRNHIKQKNEVNDPHISVIATQRLQRFQNKNLPKKNIITQEFLEYYIADLNNFTAEDFEKFKKHTINTINLIPAAEILPKDRYRIREFVYQVNFLDLDRYSLANFEAGLLNFTKKVDAMLAAYIAKETTTEYKHDLEITERLFVQEMRRKIELDLGRSIFEKAEKDIWEKSDIEKSVKERFSIDQLESLLQEKYPTEWNDLRIAQMESKILKNQNNIPKLTNLYIKIAETINKIVYSSGIIKYQSHLYDLNSILKKQGNCMVLASIVHLIWKKLFGITTLGAITENHYFNVLKLPDGTFLHLDQIPGKIDIQESETVQKVEKFETLSGEPKPWVVIGDHDALYQASVWHTLSTDTRKPLNQRLFCTRQSIEREGSNPTFRGQLGRRLIETGHTEIIKEGISYINMALKMSPKPQYRYQLLIGYFKTEQFEQLEKEIKTIETAYPNDSDSYAYLGVFYEYFKKDYKKAKESYEKAEKIKRANLPLKTDYSLDNILWLQENIETR